MKDNNKGFSLVELIVVILIIAIIAVALAPQVIKWVSSAGDSVDEANVAELKECTQLALAEYLAINKVDSLDVETQYRVKPDGLYTTSDSLADLEDDQLAKLIDETMQGDYPEVHKNGASSYLITISTSNIITVEIE